MPNLLKRVKLQPRLQTAQPLAQPSQAVAWGSDLAGQIARPPENAQQMLLIVRYKIVCLAGERLGYDAGIGRIVHQCVSTSLTLTGGGRSHLRPCLMEQSCQQGEQIGRFAPEHLIRLLQHRRPDPNPDGAALAQFQERARPTAGGKHGRKERAGIQEDAHLRYIRSALRGASGA